jgi:hypothetical protein
MPERPSRAASAQTEELRRQIVSSEPKARIEAAFELAKLGIFHGVATLMVELGSSSWSVRSSAAHYLGRIGAPRSLPLLAKIAESDPESQTRNVGIYALEGLGRGACISPLIACLDDSDPARREDARTALVRVLGKSVLSVLSDDMELYDEDAGEPGKDVGEVSRVRSWFTSVSSQFLPDKVYYMGVFAHPRVFIAQLRENMNTPMDAVLMKLEDWTGESFGSKPIKKVVGQWESWLGKHGGEYQAGQRYFYGYKID